MYSHRTDKVSSTSPTRSHHCMCQVCVCTDCWCVLCACLAALFCSVQILCSGGCNRLIRRPSNRTTVCSRCDYRLRNPSESNSSASSLSASLTPLEQVGSNASRLMAALPVHSHHRAPLIHYLSEGLDSTTAATLLHTSASYVRQCRRKDYSNSDLLQDLYARDVSRQKTDPSVLTQLCDFIAASCPTKSGDRCVTYHQYVSDDALYQAYCTTFFPAVSFHTFYNIKQWMRVKHAGKYLGQFDCSKCLRLKQLPTLIAAATDGEHRTQLQLEEQRCRCHEELKNCNAITIS
jgi:hypothetical protein